MDHEKVFGFVYGTKIFLLRIQMPACEKLKVFLKTELSQKTFGHPDLPISADFFLWDILRGKVYKNTPSTIEHLKDTIH